MKMNKTLTLPTLESVIQARKSIENVVNYTLAIQRPFV
jgi:hypothetical protein